MNTLFIAEKFVYVIMNIIFFILGGFAICLYYILGGLLLCATVIGIPAGYECFKIGIACLAPFGKVVESRDESATKGTASFICNIIWIFIFGIWLAISHLIIGLIFYITIIGAPLGRKHFELMSLAFAPFGKTMVSDYEFKY
ncbi:MAG: YccF domain-containing protein [Bacteroidaceae bacterium]|nr:YccF domain-containing protein [Bacteroidaceae bacterium]